MGALAVQEQARELAGIVRSEDFVGQLELALPETVSPRRFARIAATAIQLNPDLAQCERDSVFQSLLRCAADGLMPDGREAAIVKRGTKASYTPMIGGYRKIAADFGWTLRTRAVRANDEFEWSEEPPTLTHRIARGERGELVFAYAIATHKDGTRLQRVLDAGQIAERRKKATTDRVWTEFTEQMWEKSAGRDIFDEIPKSDEDKARVARMLAAEAAYEHAAADPVAALYGRDVAEDAPPAAVPAPVEAPAPVEPAASEEPIEDGEFVPIDDVDETAAPSADEVAKAGETKVSRGDYMGKTFAEVAASGENGHTWLLVQLKRTPADAPGRTTIETYVRGALPEIWTKYEAWKEQS